MPAWSGAFATKARNRCGVAQASASVAEEMPAKRRGALARRVLLARGMAKPNDSWIVPLMVIEATTMFVGLIMMFSIFLLHC